MVSLLRGQQCALLLASRLVGTAALCVLRPSSRQLSSAVRAPSRSSRLYATAVVDASLCGGGDSRECLSLGVARALAKSFGDEHEALVTAATQKKFGDYQCNAALPLSNKLGKKPRDIAQLIIDELEADEEVRRVFGSFEIAGPGFVNARLSDAWLAATCLAMATDESGAVAVPRAEPAETIVVDYSSPNIAKEMHVGHLRSTVIGDALANVLELRGHKVFRQNHVGDWGTQFGMLIAHMEDVGGSTSSSLQDLVGFYKAAKKRFDSDIDFKERARLKVVALQGGEASELESWRLLCAASRGEFEAIYDRLGVLGLEERGESAYNDMLKDVVDDLKSQNLATVSKGATVVFDEADKDQEKNPLIVQKSDGAFNYASTDLAAAKYRSTELAATRVLYVTDSGQSSHFNQVFSVAKRAGLVPEATQLAHVPFGLVLGEDGKKFATRSGDTVRLKDLLDEAEKRALDGIVARRAERAEGNTTVAVDADDDDPADLARVIGIGAVKYADLSLNRESNYKFSYDKMLALSGNTAPYMLYSYARIAGIKRKAGDAGIAPGAVVFTETWERDLARELVCLTPTLLDVERDLRPNVLCDHLFELSQAFNRFYENCPVLQAPTPEIAASRASLCAATAASLKLGLTLLGIPVVDRI